MNEHANTNAANGAASPNDAAAASRTAETTIVAAAPAPKRRRFWLFAGLAGAATTLAACAQPGSGPRGEGGGQGRGWGGHGHHHRGWGRSGPMDPQKMAERVDRGVDRALSHVGASDEQKRKVATIAKQALTELAPMRDKLRDARRRGIEMLAAPSIDRAAIERLRAEQMQAADTLSRRISGALVDAAEVLDASQRAQLKAGLERRMGRRWS